MTIDRICDLLKSENYQERFRGEYFLLKEKLEKLNITITKYEAGVLKFRPTCPIELLRKQAKAMDMYLCDLKVRAEIEHINITEE